MLSEELLLQKHFCINEPSVNNTFTRITIIAHLQQFQYVLAYFEQIPQFFSHRAFADRVPKLTRLLLLDKRVVTFVMCSLPAEQNVEIYNTELAFYISTQKYRLFDAL